MAIPLLLMRSWSTEKRYQIYLFKKNAKQADATGLFTSVAMSDGGRPKKDQIVHFGSRVHKNTQIMRSNPKLFFLAKHYPIRRDRDKNDRTKS
jgi:hypothetical protein